MKENFMLSIVHFNTDVLTDNIWKIFTRNYLSNPEYTYKRIYQANAACSPMVKWAIAHLEYAEMLDKVNPLRQEHRTREDAVFIKKDEESKINELITTREASINR